MEWIVLVILWLGLGYIAGRAAILDMQEQFPSLGLDAGDFGLAGFLMLIGPLGVVVALLMAPKHVFGAVGIKVGKINTDPFINVARKFWRI